MMAVDSNMVATGCGNMPFRPNGYELLKQNAFLGDIAKWKH